MVCTSISSDGVGTGCSPELTGQLAQLFASSTFSKRPCFKKGIESNIGNSDLHTDSVYPMYTCSTCILV